VRIVLDTNVFVSGVFFGGPPYEILNAWREGRLMLMVSPDILAEYHRVSAELARQYPQVDLEPFLELLVSQAQFLEPPALPEPVSDDPDDDKFLACALAANCKHIVSGDRHLLRVGGYRGIAVVRPRQFLDDFVRTDVSESSERHLES